MAMGRENGESLGSGSDGRTGDGGETDEEKDWYQNVEVVDRL